MKSCRDWTATRSSSAPTAVRTPATLRARYPVSSAARSVDIPFLVWALTAPPLIRIVAAVSASDKPT